MMQKIRFGFGWKESWFSYIPVMVSVLILRNIFHSYLLVPFLLLSWENCFKVSRYSDLKQERLTNKLCVVLTNS